MLSPRTTIKSPYLAVERALDLYNLVLRGRCRFREPEISVTRREEHVDGDNTPAQQVEQAGQLGDQGHHKTNGVVDELVQDDRPASL